MRLTLINTILCLFIVVVGIALSSSSSMDADDNSPANIDWSDLDTYYPVHALNARATKSRFWKRAPHRKFWKRSILESAADNIHPAVSTMNEQENH
jgi:hypothetical protein